MSCVDRGHFCIYHDDTDAPDLCRSAPISLFLTYVRILLASMTYVRWLVGTKHFPESKTRPRIQKHLPEPKTLPRIQTHFQETKHTSCTHPRIQNTFAWFWDVFLNSGTCFGVWEVFWILGRIFEFLHVFWILGSVLSL